MAELCLEYALLSTDPRHFDRFTDWLVVLA